MRFRAIISLTMLLAAIMLEGCASLLNAPTEEQLLVDEAALTFERFLHNPDFPMWYRAQRKNIKAIFIVPRFLRGAFLVGAAGGKGVLLAQDFVHGGWSPPAFYTMSAASVGPQAGVDSSEVILVVQTFSGLRQFHGMGTMKLGLDAGLTMGPMGEGGTLGVDIATFTSSGGLYGGMSLDELAVTASDSSNEVYYGQRVKPEEILSNTSVSNPGADRLRAVIGQTIVPGDH